MSWGYWGIVTGLAVLVATFFICLELVYSSSKISPDASPRLADGPGESSKETFTSGRLAA
jgi:hypothetical protein